MDSSGGSGSDSRSESGEFDNDNYTNVIDLKKIRENNKIVYECGCGCQLWYVVPDGLECSDCGDRATFD